MKGLPPEFFEYMGSQRTILILAFAGALLSILGGFAGLIAVLVNRQSNPLWTAYGVVFGLAFIIAGIAFS